jgi:hypothetical protein
LQFRLAYVSPESRVVGAGDLVDVLKKIGVYYLKSYFLIDLFVVLPLPQVKFFSSSSILHKLFSAYSVKQLYIWDYCIIVYTSSNYMPYNIL